MSSFTKPKQVRAYVQMRPVISHFTVPEKRIVKMAERPNRKLVDAEFFMALRTWISIEISDAEFSRSQVARKNASLLELHVPSRVFR